MGCEHTQSATDPLPIINLNKAVNKVAPHLQREEPFEYSLNRLKNSQQMMIFQQQRPTLSVQDITIKPISQPQKINEAAPQIEAEINNIDINKLLQLLLQEMKQRLFYSRIVDMEYISFALEEFQQNYIPKHFYQDIFLLLVIYIEQIHNKNSSEDDLLKFVRNFGERLIHIKEQITTFNIKALKVIQYLRYPVQSQSKGSFLDLKFELNISQLENVINTVKAMLNYEAKSTLFITLYLYISAQKLQKMQVPVFQIQNRMSACFNLLSKHLISIQQRPTLSLPSFTQSAYNKVILNFAEPKSQRVQFADAFIVEKATEAEQVYFDLRKLLWEAGNKSQSAQISTFSGSDRAMLEARRGIIDVQMEEVDLEATSKEIEELTLDDLYFLEQLTYKQQMKEIFAFIDSPIEFKTHSLLQARLYFQHISHIQECAAMIQQELAKRNDSLNEVINRLSSKSFSQVLLKVTINKIYLQIHLIFLANYGSQFFNVSIKTLVDNRNLTCCSHLKMIAEHYLPEYLIEMKELIEVNRHSKAKDINIQAHWQHFCELQSLILFNLEDKSCIKVHSSVLQKGANLLHQFKKESQQTDSRGSDREELSKLYRMVQLKKIMKDSTANLQSNEFYHQFELNRLPYLELLIQKKQNLQQNDIDLLKKYSEHIKMTGINLLKKKMFEKAEKKFEIYIRISSLLENQLMKAQGKRVFALLEFEKGNFNRAIQLLEKGLNIIDAFGSDFDRLPFLDSLAKVFASQEKYVEALKVYKRYLKASNDVEKANSIKILNAIGQLYQKMQEWDSALKIYEQCLQQQEAQSGFNSFENIDTLIKISETLKRLGDKEKSRTYAQKCLQVIKNYKQKEDAAEKQIKVRTLIATLYRNNGKYDAAIQILLPILQIIEQSTGKLNYQYSQALSEIGVTHEMASNFQASLGFYEQALMLKEKIDSKNELGHLQLIGKIALGYEKLNNIAKSRKYQAKMALILGQKNHSPSKGNVNTFITIGKKSLQKGNYPLSIKYFKISLTILEQTKGKQSLESFPLLKNIGVAYKLQGHLDESIRFFTDSLQVLEKYKGKNNIEAAEIYYELGNIYIASESVDLAQTYYLAAIQLYQKYNVRYIVYANASFDLGNLYFMRQNYTKAFECFQHSLPILEKLNPKKYLEAVEKMDACDDEIEQVFPHTAEKITEEHQVTEEKENNQQ